MIIRTGRLRPLPAFAALIGFTFAGMASADPTAETFASLEHTRGFPETVVIHDDRVYVTTPAIFGTAGTAPSEVLVHDRFTGALIDRIVVEGEVLAEEHGLSNAAVDADGRLYVLSTQLGVLRFTPQADGYRQESWGAPLPDLPICLAGLVSPCSPTLFDQRPLGNDIVFDAAGNAYVSDSFQATIFRYPPTGGAPEIWFQSPQLEGGLVVQHGVNGMRFDPQRDHLYLASSSASFSPTLGRIFRLPAVDAPARGDLELFHAFPLLEVPDQLAFAANGDLYVSLSVSNQIAVLAPDGREVVRMGNTGAEDIPLDAPAGIAFDPEGRLFIANHASVSRNPAHFAVLTLDVNQAGDPLDRPAMPSTPQ